MLLMHSLPHSLSNNKKECLERRDLDSVTNHPHTDIVFFFSGHFHFILADEQISIVNIVLQH